MAPPSIEQIRQVLLDAVGDVEGQRLDGRCRVHAAGSDPDADIDDEEVLHVVAAATFIHDGSRWVRAHARGAEQMSGIVQRH